MKTESQSTPNYDQFRLLEATSFAARAHDGQLRKHPAEQPYISHPFFVATILMRYGYTEDVVIAGLLHDVVEDTKYTSQDISQRFGQNVADLVADVTEDMPLPKEERMRKYLDHLKTASEDAKALSAADFLANRYDLLMHMRKGETEIWDKFKLTPEKNLEIDAERIGLYQGIHPGLLAELTGVWNELKKITLNR